MHEHEYIVLEGHQALRDVRVSLGVSSLRLSPVYLGKALSAGGIVCTCISRVRRARGNNRTTSYPRVIPAPLL